MPGQTLSVELFHKRIGVELFHIKDTRFVPEAFHEHDGADGCRNAGGIANSLSSRLLVCRFMAAVIVDVVGPFLTILDTTDATTDRCLSRVVLSELTRIGQHRLQKLNG